MKVTTKGQVTIPQEIRNELGIHPGTEVSFEVDGESVKLTPTTRPGLSTEEIIARMRGRGDVPMTTDEIMALTRGND